MGYKWQRGQEMHRDEEFCRSSGSGDLLHVLYKLLMAGQHFYLTNIQNIVHCSARNSKVNTFNEYPKHILNNIAIDFFH